MNSSISRLLYFGVALLLCCGLKAREHAIQGYVVDNITGDGIGNAEVVLLTSDSIAIDTCYTYAFPSDVTLNGLYNGLNVTKVGKYILRVAASGYETEYIDVRLRSGREDYISVPTIYLVKEQTKTLKEIVVRTSPGFRAINIGNFNYGLKAQLPLPWKINFSTDLINYAHRGYDLKEMNTDELVWNVNITKSLCKGKLLLGVKAYDILGQINSRTYFIDAQGRTEMTSNVIPRYILFSAAWKFHKSPKKRTDK